MTSPHTSFDNEEALVAAFLVHLESGYSLGKSISYVREFDYTSGRTDVLVLGNESELIAYEAKLTNWRKALHQAWRNSSFANQVFVVMPQERESSVLKHVNEFIQRGVGLCFVGLDGLRISVQSKATEPVIPWLHTKAMAKIQNDGYRPEYKAS